jgi:hypothetical protein
MSSNSIPPARRGGLAAGGGTAERAQAAQAEKVSSNGMPPAGRGGLMASCGTGEGVQYPTCQKRRVVVLLREHRLAWLKR